MIEFIKQQKAGVISGIVASAFFIYFIQPILDFLVTFFFAASNYIGSTYIDGIYQKAAHLETYDFSFIFPASIAGVFSIILITTSALLLFAPFVSSKDKVTKDKERASKDIPKSASFIAGLLFFIIGIYGASDVASNYVQLSAVSSFKQHLRIIAPYITSDEEEMLISKWSLMKSQNDYYFINSQLESVALKNNIELPVNRLY